MPSDTKSKKSSTNNERRTKKRKKTSIYACTASCKYDLVKSAIKSVGMVLTKEDISVGSESNLIWCDSIIPSDRIQELKNYQKINHFPNMGEICRKDYLARNMARMRKVCPDEYDFTPKSWIMPSEYNLLYQYSQDCRKRKRKQQTIFIHKPSNGAMGNGIRLFKNPEKSYLNDHTIVQQYLDKPLLLDGYKIDLRLYVLITHCDPLRAFLYQDGLVRLSTEKYSVPTESNIDQLYMHLTNYSVNRYNENFQRHHDFDRGSKRSVKSLLEYLSKEGHDSSKLWRNISDLIVKTLIVASPHVTHAYKMCRPGQSSHSNSVCFEVLGFDIFLDKKLKPWLLEVNRAPSFGGDERIDREIKTGVIRDALILINLRAGDKRRNLALQKAATRERLFKPFSHHTDKNLENAVSKKKFLINRKKEELKEKLAWVRLDAAREEYEDSHMGNYCRIFPCVDSNLRNKYTKLLTEAFKLFHCSRSVPFEKNLIEYYIPKREDEILHLIEKCEEEEGIKPSMIRKSLSSMPTLTPPPQSIRSQSDESSSSEDESSESDQKTNSKIKQDSKVKINRYLQPKMKSNSKNLIKSPSRQRSSMTLPNRSRSAHCSSRLSSANSSRSLNKFTESSIKQTSVIDLSEDSLIISPKDRETENTHRILLALNRTKIKFPGKSDEEADKLIANIMNSWRDHKSQIAHYWLVQLDTAKRKKVIDIVQGNVRAVVERVWRWSDVSNLKLSRLLNRVFNRMQWCRGQGLWSCFLNSDEDAWETIFSKSTEVVKEVEMDCCRRAIRLCKDCLLIVYQFANEARKVIPIQSKSTTSLSKAKLSETKINQKNISQKKDKIVSVIPTRFTRSFNYDQKLKDQFKIGSDFQHIVTSDIQRRTNYRGKNGSKPIR